MPGRIADGYEHGFQRQRPQGRGQTRRRTIRPEAWRGGRLRPRGRMRVPHRLRLRPGTQARVGRDRQAAKTPRRPHVMLPKDRPPHRQPRAHRRQGRRRGRRGCARRRRRGRLQLHRQAPRPRHMERHRARMARHRHLLLDQARLRYGGLHRRLGLMARARQGEARRLARPRRRTAGPRRRAGGMRRSPEGARLRGHVRRRRPPASTTCSSAPSGPNASPPERRTPSRCPTGGRTRTACSPCRPWSARRRSPRP